MKKYRNLTRVFSVILVLCMALSVLPITALAAGDDAKYYFGFSNGGYCATTSRQTVQLYYSDEEIVTANTTVTLFTQDKGDISADAHYLIYAGGKILGAYADVLGVFTRQVTTFYAMSAVFEITQKDGGYIIKAPNGERNFQTPLWLHHENGTVSFVTDVNLASVVQIERDSTSDGSFTISWGAEPVQGPVLPTVPTKPTDGKEYREVKHYVGFAGTDWYTTTEKHAMQLYHVTDEIVQTTSNGTLVTSNDEVQDDNYYLIYEPSATPPRAMHIASNNVNRCSGSAANNLLAVTHTAHVQTFRKLEGANNAFAIYNAETSQWLKASASGLSLSTVQGDAFFVDVEDNGDCYIYTITYEELKSGMDIAKMFTTSGQYNTWVFTGGANVSGNWEQTRGMRNFVGHFEEHIRWTNCGSTYYGRQRYTLNTAKSGLTLAEIVGNFDEYVGRYDPMAAAYLIGPEDFDSTTFESDLTSFIDSALDMRGGTGFAVIQLPVAGTGTTCAATAARVVETYKTQEDKYARIVLVPAASGDGLVDGNGYLTEKGHQEVGKQLSLATIGNVNIGQYPNKVGVKDLKELPMANNYLRDVMPSAVAGTGVLRVTVPTEAGEGSWSYELRLDDMTVKGTAAGNEFAIPGLPESGSYVLIVRTGDGNTQLAAVKGSLECGEKSEKNVQENLTTAQSKIAQKVAGNDPMTWVFIGDSITHGAQWLYGYDSVSQLFDEFLVTIGREDDLVINTAVSSADANETVTNMDARLQQFFDSTVSTENDVPDVVSIQLGTNDYAYNRDETTFSGQLEAIINAAKALNPNVIIVLRAPTACPADNRRTCAEQYGGYMQRLKAKLDPTGDYIIYNDQYTDMNTASDLYTWVKTNNDLFGNALHPGPVGHLAMFRDFVEGCGIWTEDSPMTNLYYQVTTRQNNTATPTITYDEDEGTISVTEAAVQTAWTNSNTGEIILTAKNETTGVSYSTKINSLKRTELAATLTGLPYGEYTVTVEVTTTGAKNHATFKSSTASSVLVPEPDIDDLPEELVTVTCDNPNHAGTSDSATYSAYDVENSANRGVTFGTVTEDDGVYTVAVTVAANLYVNKFSADQNNVPHNLGSNPSTMSFTMTYNVATGLWTVDGDGVPVTFTAPCNATAGTTPPPATGGGAQIPEDNTPLAPAPDDGDADIEDGSTPLAPAPDKGDTDIEDGDTPLDSTPKTGDEMMSIVLLWVLCTISAFCLGGIAYCGFKSGKHSK